MCKTLGCVVFRGIFRVNLAMPHLDLAKRYLDKKGRHVTRDRNILTLTGRLSLSEECDKFTSVIS